VSPKFKAMLAAAGDRPDPLCAKIGPDVVVAALARVLIARRIAGLVDQLDSSNRHRRIGGRQIANSLRVVGFRLRRQCLA